MIILTILFILIILSWLVISIIEKTTLKGQKVNRYALMYIEAKKSNRKVKKHQKRH